MANVDRRRKVAWLALVVGLVLVSVAALWWLFTDVRGAPSQVDRAGIPDRTELASRDHAAPATEGGEQTANDSKLGGSAAGDGANVPDLVVTNVTWTYPDAEPLAQRLPMLKRAAALVYVLRGSPAQFDEMGLLRDPQGAEGYKRRAMRYLSTQARRCVPEAIAELSAASMSPEDVLAAQRFAGDFLRAHCSGQ